MKYKLRSILQTNSVTFYIKNKNLGISKTITFTDLHPKFSVALNFREDIAISELYLSRNRISQEDYDFLLSLYDSAKALSKWSDSNLTVTSSSVLYNGVAIPADVENFLINLFLSDPSNKEAFGAWSQYLGLITNPDVSFKVAERLFLFLSKNDLTITPDGYVLAWKVVRPDFKDKYSGKFDNSPGQVLQMARNKVNDNDNDYCSYGFHVCSWDYLSGFASHGDAVVQVKVHPADVMSIPLDYNGEKVRVCKYSVSEFVGTWGVNVDARNLPVRTSVAGFSANND